MTDPKETINAAAMEADKTIDQPMPTGSTPTRPNKSVPVSVRLSPDDVAAIDQLADAMGMSASTLIRGWIQQGLTAKQETTVKTALDQIAADVQRLHELVA